MLVVTLVSCDPSSAPLNQYEGGLSVAANDRLQVWLGADCVGLTAIEVQLNDADDQPTDLWRVEAEGSSGRLSSFTLGEVPSGFGETDALQGEWRSADTVRIRIESGTGRTSSYAAVDSFLSEAEGRGVEEVFVQDQGWTTSAGYQDLVADETVYPLCEPADA